MVWIEGTEMAYAGGYEKGNALAKTSYTHDALIDMIIANPECYQYEFAQRFGYTPAWISQVMASDAFKARLELRKEEIVNPALIASVRERLEGVAQLSMQKLQEKLEVGAVTVDHILKAVDISTKALGYGARERGGVSVVQNNYVVALPGKAASAAEWAKDCRPEGVIEGEATKVEHQSAPLIEVVVEAPQMVPAVGTGEMIEVSR
jgi:hypothetical protein